MLKGYSFSITLHAVFIVLFWTLFYINADNFIKEKDSNKVRYRVNLVASSPDQESHYGSIIERPPDPAPDREENTQQPREEQDPNENTQSLLPEETGGDPITVQIPGAGPEDSYVKTIVRKVGRNYRDPLNSSIPRKIVTIRFMIHSDGSITDIQVEESSGDNIFDISGMRAVKNAAPFPPLPQRFGSSVTVHFYFEHRSN